MSYDENSTERYQKTIKICDQELRVANNPIIYDIGGYGALLEVIREKYCHTNLMDMSSPDLNTKNLNIKDDSSDIIFLCEVIEHLYDPDQVIRECHRCLKDEGILVLTTPNLCSWFNRILLVFGCFPLNMDISCQLRYTGKRDILSKVPFNIGIFNPLFDVHIRLYTVDTLKILLEEWGFEITDISGYTVSNSTHHKINNLLGFVNKIFGKFPTFAQGLIIKAKAVK